MWHQFGRSRHDSPATSTGDVRGLVVKTVAYVGQIGAQTAEMLTEMEMASEGATMQAVALTQLKASSESLERGSNNVRDRALSVLSLSDEIIQSVEECRRVFADSVVGLSDLTQWLDALAVHLSALTEGIEKTAEVATRIDQIANQTHILSLNATLEAARSGSQFQGFAAIAANVRAHASETRDAAKAINDALTVLASPLSQLQSETGKIGRRATAIGETGVQTSRALQGVASIATAVGVASEHIGNEARSALADVSEARAAIATLAGQAKRIEGAIVGTRDQVERFLELGSDVLNDASHLNIVTDESAFIALAVETAAKISQLFSEALRVGDLTEAVLFDDVYRPIPDTEPTQHLTDVVAYTDRALPAVQEPVLSVDTRIVFAAAMDRNGYIATHNRDFSHPQRDDPSWNRAHARNRTIFADPIAIRAGSNRAGHLLQIYRREMGGGTHHILKDVSAPISVNGRHWGAFRIGYRAADATASRPSTPGSR